MGAQRRWNNPQYSVILGLCPGCDNWQVDYTDDLAASFVELRIGSEGGIKTDTTPWHLVIEDVLQEHLRECPPLQQIATAAGIETG